MERSKRGKEKPIPQIAEDEIHFLPTEELLQSAEIILEQYAADYEKLANCD